MKFLGLNSPEIFLISVIILIILGPKRIERGWLLFQRLLKFLLGKEEELEVKSEATEISEVKEEELEVKSETTEISEVKEEELEVKSEAIEISEVKEEVLKPKLKEEKSKAKNNKKENGN